MKKEITVYTFLQKVLNLYCKTHTKLHFSNDPWHINDTQTLSVYYALQEIEALSKAFGLYSGNTDKSNFKSLIEGDFLEKMPYLSCYPIILDKYSAFFNSIYKSITNEEIKNINIYRIYKGLLASRLDIQKVIYNNKYINIEGKGLEPAFKYHIIQKIQLKELDEFIANLWNPHNYAFTKETLIHDFNYPNIDIETIERDGIIEDWI